MAVFLAVLVLIVVAVIVWWALTNKSKTDRRLSSLAITISFCALLFTGLSFYYQYLRKANDVMASVISIWPNTTEGNHCVADIVFTNNGNRACSIVDVKFQFGNKATTSMFKDSWISMSDDQSPFTIRPTEVISKQFKMGTPGKLDAGRGANPGDRIEYALCFELVDSDGKLHRVTKPLFFTVAGEDESQFHGIGLLPQTVILLPSPIDKTGLGVMTP